MNEKKEEEKIKRNEELIKALIKALNAHASILEYLKKRDKMKTLEQIRILENAVIEMFTVIEE